MAATAWNAAPALTLDFVSDERLARLASRGDQRAFGVLYERYRADLERYCRSILRNGADAEDAAQNAMVSALRAFEGGTVPMRVKPWLYKIAHNEAISVARRRRPVEELDESALGAAAGDEDAGAVRERLGQLMADLKALTERQREALVLRELCGLSYTEIGQSLGSSEAAAQQTVFEARSALMAFGEGRALDCERIQRAMSECDGMRLRTRRFRAHLRGCECCRDFEASLLARRRDLGLLFPPSGAAGGIAALLARLAGGIGLKSAAVGLAVLAAGGTVVVTTQSGGPSNPSLSRVGSPTAGGPGASPTASAHGGGAAPAAQQHHRGKAKRPTAHHGHATKNPGSSQAHTSAPGANPPASTASDSQQASAGTHTNSTVSHSRGGKNTSVTHQTAPNVVSNVVDTANQTVSTVTDTANQVVGDVTHQINQTSTTATDTVTQIVDGAKNTAGGVVPHLP